MPVHAYRASLRWLAEGTQTVDYEGYSRTFDAHVPGKPVLVGSSDVPFRGDAQKHNPEDLLLIALSSCHLLSYLALCARHGIVVTAYTDDATGTMAFREGKMRFTEVTLRPRVTLASGDRERALRLHDNAHAECFIASSVNFPVRHEPAFA